MNIKSNENNMKTLKFKMTVSRNEVNENFSVMCLPSTMTIKLTEEKTKTWNEVKEFNPNIIYHWAQQIWDMKYPNNFGKVINVEILS